MRWEKKGLLYGPDGSLPWARHSALQPTPLVLADEGLIRVYAGFRDEHGISRPGYVEVDAGDPSRVVRVSPRPVLDVGEPGTFDDNGVVPCAVVPREDGRVFMYYAGYQIPARAKFLVFGGLAVSDDGGRTFRRHARVPLLDRTDDEPFFRVAHSVLYEDGRWRAWYGGGSTWVTVDGKALPVYDVRYMESPDGIRFPDRGTTHVGFADPDEYRIGRPYVFRAGGGYRMLYGVATRAAGYRLGYAESPDGHAWTRMDGQAGLSVSDDGWDSGMVAYPAVASAGGRTYLFYNGNDMGRSGFGWALLRDG